MFKVYDKVWVMIGSKPSERLVFAVVESMDYYKQGTETHYRLVESRVGAGWGNNEGIRADSGDVFATRGELIESLSREGERSGG